MLFAATLGMFHKSVLKKMKLFFGEARWKFKVVNPSCLEATPSCGCGCCRKTFTFLHVLGGEVCSLAPDVRWERPATDSSGFGTRLPLVGAWEQRGRASGRVGWWGEGEWGGGHPFLTFSYGRLYRRPLSGAHPGGRNEGLIRRCIWGDSWLFAAAFRNTGSGILGLEWQEKSAQGYWSLFTSQLAQFLP